MSLRTGVLKDFNTASYTATIQMTSSYRVYLEGVPVARNLPGTEMVNGRKVAVVFFDDRNVKEAVVIAVYA